MSVRTAASTFLRSSRASSSRHAVHIRYATSSLRMPAMSPTMTEGGIANWKLKEGDSFAAGDVLLEIETDKATIDVEAADDGIMGKIIAGEGAKQVPVGQVIAILAEEGDDLGSIEIPSELGPEGSGSSSGTSTSAAEKLETQPKEEKGEKKVEVTEEKKESQSQSKGEKGKGGNKLEQDEVGHGKEGHKEIRHSKPLFPSVSRLLYESSLTSEQIQKLKGTGKGGMLTKGDVLVALGKVKNPWGSAEKLNMDIMGASGKRRSEAAAASSTSTTDEAPKEEKPLDGPALRRLIVQGLTKATEPAKPIIPRDTPRLPLSSDAEFDAILAPYASLLPPVKPALPIPNLASLAAMQGKGSSSKPDEWAGLF